MHECCLLLLSLFSTILSLHLPRGAYIHIPFCRRRCFYCNFPVVVVGERQSSQELQGTTYTALLLREMEATIQSSGDSIGALETVYFGGGTPSLLPAECILQILSKLRSLVGITENAEVTLEMDPGTFDLDKLLQLRAAGITRLSLGVQSFDKDVLKKCGRAHTVEDVDKALRLVLSSDFKNNFSVDLISSLPGLSVDLWQETLQKAAGSGCSHISVYDLQVEDKTAFGRWYSPGVFPLPTDEQSALMYCRASEILKSFGYEHYEVSNYAKPGKRSQHNQRYWGCKPTWGFGMGAASFIKNNRFTRPDRMIDYTEWLQQLELNGFTNSSVVIDDEDSNGMSDSLTNKFAIDDGDDSELVISEGIVSPPGSADILEVVMLALRTSDGLDLESLGSEYGAVSVEKILTAVRPFVEKGLVTLRSEGNTNSSLSTSNICLTDPQGFLLSNDIISSVFVELTC